ncbi:MAG: peptide chain release factor 1 [Acidobacteria bacterium]|nr:peptide chain release factor 1 [Acidobacteriota bacterium]MCB9397406.1 peptide chain release factor 1 [Acidobacteriota bacterium]
MLERLRVIKQNYEHVMAQMGDPSVASDQQRYQKLAKQHRDLEPIVQAYQAYQNRAQELAEYKAILSDRQADPELLEMAKEEVGPLETQLEEDFLELQRLLLPKDPMDGKNVILEIRAGTGGEEAALFAGEMFRAYCRFAETNNWKVEVADLSETGLGGLKEATAVIEGKDVYSRLKYESGTHRVQRVPETETQGRVHTSAITVAILPEAEDVEVHIEEKDLRIDRFRSSGAGGQHVNTTDSAVRITHIPTGIVVSCQDEKSQIKNREKAMRVLRSHLYERKLQEQHDKIAADRKTQVGSGDRSEKIRTYNFPQARVTDHRIKFTLYQLDGFMNGQMDEMINACRTFFETQRIQEQFKNN